MEFTKDKPTKGTCIYSSFVHNSPQIENISNVHPEMNRYIWLWHIHSKDCYSSIKWYMATAWITLKRIVLSEEKSTCSVVPFMWISRTEKLIHRDRNWITDYLGRGAVGGLTAKGHRRQSGVLETFFFLEQDSGSVGTVVCLSKVIKLEMDVLCYFQIIP